jgi:hypothetical protein
VRGKIVDPKSKIEVGSIVIRAYAWHCDEFGIVVDSARWDADMAQSPREFPREFTEEDYIKNFTVMWPTGNLTLEMDVELLTQRDHEELVKKANENR